MKGRNIVLVTVSVAISIEGYSTYVRKGRGENLKKAIDSLCSEKPGGLNKKDIDMVREHCNLYLV